MPKSVRKAAENTPDCADDRAKGGIQVIARMGEILRALSAHPEGLSLGEIATQVGLPRSTVQRIVTAAVQERILEPLSTGSGFRLGPALAQLLYQIQADIVTLIRPWLEKLSQELDETACLTRLKGHRVSVIDVVVAERVLRVVPTMGASVPMHRTADGKAFLASMSDEEVADYFTQEITPHLPDQPGDMAPLFQELAEIRKTGVAIDDEGFLQGVCAASVTLKTYRGTYAITLAVPTSRMRQRKDRFFAALLDTRAQIEASLGADCPTFGRIKG